MAKTRVNRKKHSRKTRRMRGGHLESCVVRENSPMNPLYKFGNFVTVTEDQMKIAKPTQRFCFGDAFTTCTVVAIVMENGYKVAAHINPVNHILSNVNEATPRQKYNPETLLPAFQKLLETNPNFRSSNIKNIYVITSLGDININRPTRGIYDTNIYNDQYAQIRKNVGQYTTLGNLNKVAFFTSIFPGKITRTTVIDLQKNKVVQHSARSESHFYIKEDGSLDLTPSES